MAYYAATNIYGFNTSADSVGWDVYAFASKAARDAYVEEANEDMGRYCADKVTRAEALRIVRACRSARSSRTYRGPIVIDPASGCDGSIGRVCHDADAQASQSKVISL